MTSRARPSLLWSAKNTLPPGFRHWATFETKSSSSEPGTCESQNENVTASCLMSGAQSYMSATTYLTFGLPMSLDLLLSCISGEESRAVTEAAFLSNSSVQMPVPDAISNTSPESPLEARASIKILASSNQEASGSTPSSY